MGSLMRSPFSAFAFRRGAANSWATTRRIPHDPWPGSAPTWVLCSWRRLCNTHAETHRVQSTLVVVGRRVARIGGAPPLRRFSL